MRAVYFLQHQQGIVCNGDPVRIFREIGASGEIVQTDIVEIRQQDGKSHAVRIAAETADQPD